MESEPGLQAIYSSLSHARLESAGTLLRQHPDCPSDNGLEALITRCNIAMLVWSAAIDIGASLMIQDTLRIPNGISGEISLYIGRTVASRYPELGLPFLWRRLVQLHNVQHRADHEAERFTSACRTSVEAFERINQLLTPASRLTPVSYEWLATVGEE